MTRSHLFCHHTQLCVLTIWRLDQKTQVGAAGKLQGHVCVPCCVIIVAFGIDRGGGEEKKGHAPLDCSPVAKCRQQVTDTRLVSFFDIGLCNN
jgi:hypothetical protein